MLDLIIKNGSSYIDGELNNQNIGIKDGKIVEIGKIENDSINILIMKYFCGNLYLILQMPRIN